MTRPKPTHPESVKAQDTRIDVQNLVVRRQQKNIVDSVSLHVRAGEVLGLIGPNGAGKSTILAAMAGIETPDSGSILIDTDNIGALQPHERAQKLGWLEQHGTVHWPLTVERLVMLGRIPHLPPWGNPTETDLRAVDIAIEKADCASIRQRKVPTLSGGERARVLLARALAAEPSVLLADEPVSSLDLAHQLQTMQLLHDYATTSRAVVVVIHDLSLAVRYCHRLALLHKGKLVATGEPAAVLSNQNIADVYGVSVVTGCETVPWVVPEHLLDT
ncbi:MAG: ABC transporter ATP-binding protein [Granulosicoccus sp.]